PRVALQPGVSASTEPTGVSSPHSKLMACVAIRLAYPFLKCDSTFGLPVRKAEIMSAVVGKKIGNSSVGSPAVSPRRRSQQLGINAKKVVSKRYSLKDAKGEPFEDWEAIVSRVVGHVSKAETGEKRDMFFEAMKEVMLAREFIPNTPCLVNAGKPHGQLAACFVLDVPDPLNGIMNHAKAAATIHQTGGGTGMTYEFLRPHGAMVSSATGVASGPVSF